MLMKNTALKKLDIGWNKLISDDGMKLITEGLHHNNTMIKLDTYGCGFSVEGM